MSDINLDELQFTQVHFGMHLAMGGNKTVKVVLPPNAFVFKVLVLDTSFESKYSIRGGFIQHTWSYLNPTQINGWRLNIDVPKVLISLPVTQGELYFYPASWLYEYSLDVEAAIKT
ncbi:hypothetical protein H6G27_09925 [Nostoc linckia FACHB-104]|nr:hypothetical protein [Nostoc linckia FACHB-104]